MEEDYLNKDNRLSREDVLNRGHSIFGQEQIDQLILTPDGRATVMVRKAPNIVKIPVYVLNENGEKVPALDENQNPRTNELGEIIYQIKEYKEEQQGWIPVQEIVPASEMFNIDNGTGNISHEAVEFLTKTMWRYNTFCVYQQTTNNDYSIYLHKLRNDALAILNSSKSYGGGTIQAVKTFINRTDSKQWINPIEEEKKNGFFNLFGGKKKNNNEGSGSQQKTAFKNDNFM
jgi:hypothetical protein